MKRNRICLHKHLIIVCCTCLVLSCKPEFPEWETENTFPLLNANLTMQNLLGDTMFTSSDEGMLSLVYDYELTNFNLDSLTSGLDTIAHYAYNIPISISIPPGTQFINLQQQNRLKISNTHFSLLTFEKGYINIRTYNKYTVPLLFEYSIANATLNGELFSVKRTIPAAPSASTPYFYEESISIAGLRWKLYSQGNKSNCFDVDFKVWVSPEAQQSVQLSYEDSFHFFMGMSHFDVRYAHGYFGQHQYLQNENINIPFFNKISAEQILLEHVSLILRVINGCGVDLQLILRKLQSNNSSHNQSIQYAGPLLNIPLNIARAVQSVPELGDVSPKIYSFDLSQQSNLLQIIESLPDNISFESELRINPMGNISGGNDFYYHNNLQAYLQFELPLQLSLQKLAFTDTFTLNSRLVHHSIQSGYLKCVFENTFPFEFQLHLTFLDSMGTNIHSIPIEPLAEAPTLLSSGRTSGVKKTTANVYLDYYTLQKIRNAKQITLFANMATMPTDQKVRIYADYALDVRIVAFMRMQMKDINNEYE